MRINPAEIAKLFAQTMQGAKETGQPLELKAGSVVQATLLNVSNSEALIQVGNAKLFAKLDADLQAGDRVSLFVTGGQKNGAMELKVVGQQSVGEALQTMNLRELLQAVGLPEQQENKALLNEWLARQLPLQADVLRAASDVLKQQPATTPAAVATLGKMAELGIPINASTFAAMNTLDNGPRLHDLLGGVLAQIQELLPESELAATNAKEPQGASETQNTMQAQGTPIAITSADEVNAGVRNANEEGTGVGRTGTPVSTRNGQGTVSLEITSGSTTVSRPLAKQPPITPTTQGTENTTPAAAFSSTTSSQQAHKESSLFPGIKNTRQSATPNDASVPAQTTGSTGAGKGQLADPSATGLRSAPGTQSLSNQTRQILIELAQVIRGLLADTGGSAEELADKSKQLGLGFEEQLAQALRRLPADSTSEQVLDAFTSAIQQDADTGPAFKQSLLNVLGTGKELEMSGLHSLKHNIETLLQQVTGQQLMQSPGQPRSDLFYQFAAVPIKMADQQQTLELHVMSRKSPGQKSLDPGNCYILFHLNMPNLGELDVHLHIVDKVVGLRFISQKPEQVFLEADEQKELRTVLQVAGFHLGTVKVEEKKEPPKGVRLPLLPPILTQSAMDYKA